MRIILLALFFVMFAPVSAYAKEIVGVFAAVEGSVTAAGKKAKEGDSIAMGDTIKTGRGANALVVLIDETEFSLSENAELKIDDYVYDPDDKPANKARFSVMRGAFEYTSGLIAKNKKPDVKIETAYGSVGIRGTQLWGGNVEDEYGVFVKEGTVDFTNNAGSRTISRGMGTKVAGLNAMPSEVTQWGQALLGAAFGQTEFLAPAEMAMKLANAKNLNAAHLEQYLKGFVEDELKKQLQDKVPMQVPGGFKFP